MSVPNAPRNTSREVLPRLGNVIYWVGVVAGAAPPLFMFAFTSYAVVMDGLSAVVSDVSKSFFAFTGFLIAWTGICYAIGWSLRYILSGATDHPIKICYNPNRKTKDFFELLWLMALQILVWIYLAYWGVQAVIWFRFESVTWFRKILGWP